MSYLFKTRNFYDFALPAGLIWQRLFAHLVVSDPCSWLNPLWLTPPILGPNRYLPSLKKGPKSTSFMVLHDFYCSNCHIFHD